MIKIICIGKIKNKELTVLLNDYLKQMDDVSIIEIKDEKDLDGMKLEGKQVLEKINQTDHVIGLFISGKQHSSEELSQLIDDVQTFKSKNIVFIIGGSFGLSELVEKRCDYKLSFSKMTFPHQLMRLFLVEQIYRAKMIKKNHPYHK